MICELDHDRVICDVVGKGFIPCLFTFAVMDLLVIPRIRRLQNRDQADRSIRSCPLLGGWLALILNAPPSQLLSVSVPLARSALTSLVGNNSSIGVS